MPCRDGIPMHGRFRMIRRDTLSWRKLQLLEKGDGAQNNPDLLPESKPPYSDEVRSKKCITHPKLNYSAASSPAPSAIADCTDATGSVGSFQAPPPQADRPSVQSTSAIATPRYLRYVRCDPGSHIAERLLWAVEATSAPVEAAPASRFARRSPVGHCLPHSVEARHGQAALPVLRDTGSHIAERQVMDRRRCPFPDQRWRE